MSKKLRNLLVFLVCQIGMSAAYADSYYADTCLQSLNMNYAKPNPVFVKHCSQVSNPNQLKCHQALQSVKALDIETSYECIYKLDGEGQHHDNAANAIQIAYSKDAVRHINQFSGFQGTYRLGLAMKMVSTTLLQCVHGLFDMGQGSNEGLEACLTTYSPYYNYNPNEVVPSF